MKILPSGSVSGGWGSRDVFLKVVAVNSYATSKLSTDSRIGLVIAASRKEARKECYTVINYRVSFNLTVVR